MSQSNQVTRYRPGDFEAENHFYTKVLNAQIHPLVLYFLNLGLTRIVSRYLHLHPSVDHDALMEILTYSPQYLRWAGADLFKVTNEQGLYQMILIETNSCPSGQKSTPTIDDVTEQSSYKKVLENAFLPLLKERRLPKGSLCVLYDKNHMEATGYAATLADIMNEEVYLVPFLQEDKSPQCHFDDGTLMVEFEGKSIPMRCAFRYVTQKPWNRIPLTTKTKILNPILGCLAGGRNKLLAAKAYDFFNGEYEKAGIQIQTPETFWNVSKAEIPFYIDKMGGHAVIKVPYSNAGQGVFTITNQKELDSFMKQNFGYEQFIVQSLIGNYEWSSTQSSGQFYHVGTVPNKRNEIYVADLRMMISSSPDGFKPAALYSRRSHSPLVENLSDQSSSWDMLGTNLSLKNNDGSWGSDTSRLLLMDRKDFNRLGLGLDDLIEAFIQTAFSVVAIDKLARSFITKKGKFRNKLFASMNNDPELTKEIVL